MAAQGSAKAPQPTPQIAVLKPHPQSLSSHWEVWKQVFIGEVLNVLENRRYDASL